MSAFLCFSRRPHRARARRSRRSPPPTARRRCGRCGRHRAPPAPRPPREAAKVCVSWLLAGGRTCESLHHADRPGRGVTARESLQISRNYTIPPCKRIYSGLPHASNWQGSLHWAPRPKAAAHTKFHAIAGYTPTRTPRAVYSCTHDTTHARAPARSTAAPHAVKSLSLIHI